MNVSEECDDRRQQEFDQPVGAHSTQLQNVGFYVAAHVFILLALIGCLLFAQLLGGRAECGIIDLSIIFSTALALWSIHVAVFLSRS